MPPTRRRRCAAQFFERLTPRLASLPGADAAAVDDEHAAVRAVAREVLVDGRPDAGRGKRLEAGYVVISPSFFDTVGVPIRRGRAFDARDGAQGRRGRHRQRALRRPHFAGEDPIGRRIRMPDDDPEDDTGRGSTIVGVSPDIRHGNPRDSGLPDVVYVPVPAGRTGRRRGDPAQPARSGRRSSRRCAREVQQHRSRSGGRQPADRRPDADGERVAVPACSGRCSAILARSSR